MSLSIRWSPNAKEELATVLAYVDEHFGSDAALNLLDAIDATTSLIAEFPQMFPRSSTRPSIRKAVISKQNSLLYRVKAKEIQILHFWDNRRDNT